MTPSVSTVLKPGTDFLLIGGGFFGYALEMVQKLEERGRTVVWFEDRPSLDTFTKTALRISPQLVARKSEAYFDAIIALVRHQPIRDVLVIKGEALSITAIQRLRIALPAANFKLYFWDSYSNMPDDSGSKVALFDRAFTFDPVDATLDSRLSYRPLFFLDEYAHLPKTEQDVDLLFIGTVHSDRYLVLNRLAKSLPAHIRFTKILYCPSRLIWAARRVFDPSFWLSTRDEFVFSPLSKLEIQALIARSRVIVDIERPIQRGLTMRTIEMLGAGKKLVTTNARIREADFYDPRNVAIIDRNKPALSWNFFNCVYLPPKAQTLKQYSLSGWLDDILA